ncbi:uncharacterized protein Dwil_GK15651 [Drosophila willistoni]|uniref:Serine/threonine-protein phosphatase n=1 Tax=Drosophila willistoni TaxID=7260 RepID=B4MS15_DROWI|nr:serine/threonine-protein phosphatase PP1-like [Drosophila willistoni]EDW74904.1 uncharacterized protein Dwil_GK15651 [Drosophila willistoni]
MTFLKHKPNIVDLIRTLEAGRRQDRTVNLRQEDLLAVCYLVRDEFMQQKMCLQVEAPCCVVGDLHGQYDDLLRIVRNTGHPPKQRYLFLGDYVDRGQNSIETITLLLCYKLKYPDHVYLLRGNHESQSLNQIYGFFDECKRRYTIKLWKSFVDCYNCMPAAATISNRIFCCHGGLSPYLTNVEQINRLSRPTDIPDEGLLCDLLWADPNRIDYGWSKNNRGVSVVFGCDVVERFLIRNDFDLVCRAHQVVEDGYEFFAKRQLVTIFSAPNYCGVFDNAGATMLIDSNLMISFGIYHGKLTNDTQTQSQGSQSQENSSKSGGKQVSSPQRRSSEYSGKNMRV